MRRRASASTLYARLLSSKSMLLDHSCHHLASRGRDSLLTRCSTPLLQDWLGDDPQKRHRREVHFPGGRFGEAIEQAHAVVFLASDESSFVNAMDFVVDGGMTKVKATPNGHYVALVSSAEITRRRIQPPRGPLPSRHRILLVDVFHRVNFPRCTALRARRGKRDLTFQSARMVWGNLTFSAHNLLLHCPDKAWIQ